MTTIVPTVGRKVWFYNSQDQTDPIDATVIKVWAPPAHAKPDMCVNLLVVDPDTGATRCEHSVQVGDEKTAGRHYRWMPYQRLVAAKSEDVTMVR
jgi:hypothetical protein